MPVMAAGKKAGGGIIPKMESGIALIFFLNDLNGLFFLFFFCF
jgi:hypothetical protein